MNNEVIAMVNLEQKYLKELFERNQLILELSQKVKDLEDQLNQPKETEADG